jgi:small subunit ribosomal protein S6
VIDYEILLMLDPDLPEERQEEIVKRTRDLVEKGGGKWDGQDAWGRRKLAYEIDKKGDGVYHLLSFSTDGDTLDEISRVLKIDDSVMRHLATRRYKPGSTQPVAVGGPPREDVADQVAQSTETQSTETKSTETEATSTAAEEE